MSKQRKYIGVNIDWSKSFVDENGSFYCHSSPAEKQIAARVMPLMDLVIYTTDFHSIKSPEFAINGGMWPLHNVAEYKAINPKDYGLAEGVSVSPEQTHEIDRMITKSRAGIIVPKHVYFQNEDYGLSFTPADVENAFGLPVISAQQFIEGDFTYIISPKTHFDGTRTVSDYLLPDVDVNNIPSKEYTVFDLLKRKYPVSGFELVFVNTGVVENICRHYTSTGERQDFDFPGYSRIVNLEGATTELAGIGFDTKDQVKSMLPRLSKDIGVTYMTVDALIAEIADYRGR